MKKFGKFIFGTLSAAAAVGGLYCLYKNSIKKNADEDFDDFDDEMEEDDDETVSVDPENREYVSITITTEDAETDEAETAAEPAAESTEAESTQAESTQAEAETTADAE